MSVEKDLFWIVFTQVNGSLKKIIDAVACAGDFEQYIFNNDDPGAVDLVGKGV